MRVSLLRLFLVFAVVCVVAFGQEGAEQPKQTSFLRKLLSPVGYLYNKAKSGLGKIRQTFVSSKSKAIREAIENGENPLGDGVGAVMDAIDELVADGEASVGNAAKAAKEAVGETTASIKEAASAEGAGVEEAVASSKEELSAAGDAANAALDETIVDAAAEVDAVKDEIKGLEEETATKAQEAVADEAAKAADVAEEL